MKLGDLEGTPKEIKDFFENSGLRVSDYFQPPEKPIHGCWVFMPAIILLGVLSHQVIQRAARPGAAEG